MTSGRRLRVVSAAPFPHRLVERWIPSGINAIVEIVEPRTRDVLLAAVAEADVVVGDYTFALALDTEIIEAMGRCRLIQQPSVGYQHIDVEAAARHQIPVANTPGANDVAVAEHTVMAALALLRQLVASDAATRSGEWPQLTMRRSELNGRSWGIIGAGMIGRHVARRLLGWNVRCFYYDVHRLGDEIEAELGLSFLELNELLASVDVVSLHVPLTPSTHHLIGADALSRMRHDAIVVNVARGDVVDELALADALSARRLAGAAIDVFSTEPLAYDHPFRSLSSVLLSPHVAGTTTEAQLRIVKQAGANVTRVLTGEAPLNVVNVV